MAYSEKLAPGIRESLVSVKRVKEKEMMGGLTFMVNDKMCIGIIKDEMMCRIDPDLQEEVLSKKGCRIMGFTGRPMKGDVIVDETGMKIQTGIRLSVYASPLIRSLNLLRKEIRFFPCRSSGIVKKAC